MNTDEQTITDDWWWTLLTVCICLSTLLVLTISKCPQSAVLFVITIAGWFILFQEVRLARCRRRKGMTGATGQ